MGSAESAVCYSKEESCDGVSLSYAISCCYWWW